MNRIVVVVVVMLLVIGLAAGGAAYVFHKREADAAEANRAKVAAAQAEAASKYHRLSDLQSRANAALDHLSELQRAYSEKYDEAGTAITAGGYLPR